MAVSFQAQFSQRMVRARSCTWGRWRIHFVRSRAIVFQAFGALPLWRISVQCGVRFTTHRQTVTLGLHQPRIPRLATPTFYFISTLESEAVKTLTLSVRWIILKGRIVVTAPPSNCRGWSTQLVKVQTFKNVARQKLQTVGILLAIRLLHLKTIRRITDGTNPSGAGLSKRKTLQKR